MTYDEVLKRYNSPNKQDKLVRITCTCIPDMSYLVEVKERYKNCVGEITKLRTGKVYLHSTIAPQTYYFYPKDIEPFGSYQLNLFNN
uniref:Uncharacterized protein n=1 Tax=viral metagenome TaxID=1070528 RepID=A0A6M3JIV7_9ZZZZ